MSSDVLYINLFISIGSLLLLSGHILSSFFGRDKNIMIFKMLGSSILIVGSILLESYVILILNIIWLGISIVGYKYSLTNTNMNEKYYKSILYSMIFIIIFGIVSSLHINLEQLGYFSIIIYIFNFYYFSTGIFSKKEYCIFNTVGFFFLLPNIIITEIYAVLINEIIGVIFSILGILNVYFGFSFNFFKKNKV